MLISKLSIAIGCLAVVSAITGTASAGTFFVHSTVDDHDAQWGDGLCETENHECTLRAAVEESNMLPGLDTIFLMSNPNPFVLDKRSPGSSCVPGSPIGLTFLDDVQMFGDGPDLSEINGGHQVYLARVRTFETLVIDNSQDRIFSHRQNGTVTGTFIGPGNGLHDAVMMFDTGSSILVSTFNNGVLEYSRDTGAFVGVKIQPTVDGRPFTAYDIAFGAGGYLIANGLPGGGIMKFGYDGSYKGMLAAGDGFGAVEVFNPYPFACGSDTLAILVAVTTEGRIARYDAAGNFLGNFATNIPKPRGMVAKDGFVYVTSEDTNSVFRLGYDGTNYGIFVFSHTGGLSKPQFIDVGPGGELMVTSFGTHEIHRYDSRTGDFIGVFSGPENSPVGTAGSFMFLDKRANGPNVVMSQLALANGFEYDDIGGGGLQIEHGALAQLTSVVVRDNEASLYGGGISNRGQLWLNRSSLVHNKLPTGNGGETSVGGGFFNANQAFVTDCLIADNFAGKGGGVSVENGDSRTDIVNTTISGNRSSGEGGGVRTKKNAHVNINFSTIYQNHTNVNGSEDFPYGGGIYSEEGGQFFIGNSIIAGNVNEQKGSVNPSNPDYAPDCYSPAAGSVKSYSDLLIGALTSKCSIVDRDTTNPPFDLQSGTVAAPLDPELLELGEYGGNTQTHMPKPGSPAVDHDLQGTTLELFNCGPVDQRGFGRPVDGDNDGATSCDLGAVEMRTTGEDFDADGLANLVDLDPDAFSSEFADSGNTHGFIGDNGGQLISVTDAASPSEGVTISTDAAGGSEPALISLCSDNLVVEMGPGETRTFTCVTASAGDDQRVECSGSGHANVILTGNGASLSGSPVNFSWNAPGVALQNPNQATASGSFALGTTTATLLVTRGLDAATDTVTVTVIDTRKPVLTVPADVFAPSCTAVSIGQATATDACGGAITITNDAPSSYKAGVRLVTWTARDAAGNSVTGTQRISVGLGDNQACCPAGTNVIVGNGSNNTLTGTAGPDCILGKGGQDIVRGLGGNDFLSGGDGDDTVEGGDGDDVLSGDVGQDILRGQNGADTAYGGAGDDQCFGGELDDSLFGGSGQDKLYGENGNDRLFGEDGDDRLEGAAGNDLLNGGTFNDTCLGGTGTNTLVSCEF